jgi:dTMP kinase
MAYQGAGSGVPMDELAAVQRFATGGLVPDLTILLDLPVDAGLARKSAEVTRFEAYHDRAYHQRVRDAFLAFAAAEPGRYATVDATRDEAGVLAATVSALRRVAALAPCLDALPSSAT